MSFVTAALIVGGATVLGAGANIYASSKAADATKKAAGTATNAELEQFYQARADTAPWREAGERALNALETKVNAGPGEFIPEETPGYKFGYKEFVEKPILRNASARGRVRSPATDKALTRYATDYAEQGYDKFLNRYYNALRPLQSLAGVGQTSAENTASRGIATGQSIGQNVLEAGKARSSAYTQSGNAVAGAADSGVSNYLLLNALKSGGGGPNPINIYTRPEY